MFRWRARGAVAGPDAIVAIVDDAATQRCLNAACTRYRITYGLQMDMLQRRWRPALFRVLTNWWLKTHAGSAPPPLAISSNCGNGRLDEAALRRVIGSVSNFDIYLHGYDPEPQVSELSALARFKPYIQSIKRSPSIFIAAAFASDQPQGPRRGLELYQKAVHPIARKNAYRWLHFDTADNEPICIGRTKRASERNSSGAPAPIDIKGDATYRFWDYINSSERLRVKLATKPNVAVTAAGAGRAVTLDWPTSEGAWRGVYVYGANGMLTESDIQRPPARL